MSSNGSFTLQRGAGSPVEFDVCVIGGGPAGSVAAKLLAERGHGVCILERAARPRLRVGESLAPGMAPVLELVGLRTDVEEFGFPATERGYVQWGGPPTQCVEFAARSGLQVNRDSFDALLLGAAERAGAHVWRPVGVRLPLTRERGRWAVCATSAGRTRRLRARFLVDASGKHAVLRAKRVRLGAALVAIHGYWRGAPASGHESRVETGEDFWAWAAPFSSDRVSVAVFADPARCHPAGKLGLRQMLSDTVAGTEVIDECITGATLGDVTACDASSYLAQSVVGDDWIKVGEAAYSIDPMSSQGVQNAIQSAHLGALTVDAILSRAPNAREAKAFFDSQQRRAAHSHRAHAASYYAVGADYYGSPFWTARAVDASRATEPRDVHALSSAIGREHVLRLDSNVVFRDERTLEDGRVTSSLALVHPALDRPVAFIDDIRVSDLLADLGEPLRVHELLDRWKRITSGEKALRVLRWALQRGILVPAR